MLKLSGRGQVPPFFVMEVMRAAFERERAGGKVFHLEVGQPSTPAPAGVRAAAARALTEDRLGYTDALGIPPLRQAIARHLQASYGVDVPPRRIAVTTGSSAGFLLAFIAAFEPGDRVAMAVPGYPGYRHILTALGITPVPLITGPETGFQPTVPVLEAWQSAHPGERLDGLIVASPANPTGSMIDRAALEALADYCLTRGVRLVSDEIYHGITFAMPPTSALAVAPDAVVVNSFSKYFSMTGWRLGWIVVPEDMIRAIETLAQNLYISAPTLSQLAGVAAFDCRDELDGHVARYAANRARLLEALPAAGFDRIAPADGAFYLYLDVSHLADDSEALCRDVLARTGVAITPGIDFDPERGRHTVRLSFCGAEADVAEAARRLAAWVGSR